MILESKYNIGDPVYRGDYNIKANYIKCDICDGDGLLRIVVKNEPMIVNCGSCGGKGNHLNGRTFDVNTRKLHIGSIRYDSYNGNPNNKPVHFSYMCGETGVGTGSVFYEDELFDTEEAALEWAEIRGAKRLAEMLEEDEK